MSFPKYNEYKDSGVEWIDEVPRHWGIDRFKRSTVSCRNGIWGSEAKGDENDIPCVRVADFDREQLSVCDDIPTIRNVTESERSERTLSNGNLLLEKSGGGDLQPVGFVVLYDHDEPAVCSNFVAKMELAEGMVPSYWRYCHAAAYSVRLNYRSIKQTSGIQNLDQSQYLDERAPFPPPDEQKAISSFLDVETSKIDGLVSEQRRLIELLKEKRQAVISHAVTKGLNPNVPMKRSGIEWLGDVPQHWEVKPVRYACDIHNTLRTPIDKQTRSDIEGDYPYYGPTGILSWINKFVVEGEYFLVGEDGDHFLKFRIQPMTVNVSAQFNVNNHAHLIKGKGSCSTKWASLYFEHKDLMPWLIKQGVGRYKLRKEKLVRIPILVPPLNEQGVILAEANRVKKTTESLIAEAKRAIDLLQERRTALISAAVTGKIDVREFAYQETA